MEVCCAFKTITGGICGSDSRDRKKDIQVVPLSACSKDIENHLSSYTFTGPLNEVDLTLDEKMDLLMFANGANVLQIWSTKFELNLHWRSK